LSIVTSELSLAMLCQRARVRSVCETSNTKSCITIY